MIAFKKIIVLFLLPISASCQSVSAEDIGRNSGCDSSISIQTSLENVGNKHFLSFNLLNGGKHLVSIYNSNLPWGSITSTTLVLIPSSKAADPLEGSYYVDDPTNEKTSIEPGKSLKGKLDISDLYPRLEGVLSKKEVILFWSHQPESTENQKFCRAGGFLLINRKS